ncbi:MAG: hypothetical protein CM15mP115_23740 [Alphaproteobacteria bacterium]|nr:MAG: hypothetical protein CM15mP115_23740 [Alphaproteobacteria bacterium]
MEKVGQDVSGTAVPGGHYCAEEAPDETLAALTAFFGSGTVPQWLYRYFQGHAAPLPPGLVMALAVR